MIAVANACCLLADAVYLRLMLSTLAVYVSGPLTNIAIAVKLCPELPSLIERLVVMAGSRGPGNMSPTAEYNAWCDPEALSVVLNKFPLTTLVTLDLGLSHPFPIASFEAVMKHDSLQAKFFSAITRKSLNSASASGDVYLSNDAQACGIAVIPSSVTSSERLSCKVELQGSALTRGMTVFSNKNTPGYQHNVELVKEINVDVMLAAISDALSRQLTSHQECIVSVKSAATVDGHQKV